MTQLIYQQLAYHIDKLPGGFPSTETGVELRILKQLFTPEEAQLTLNLTIIPEPVRVIAARAMIPIPIAEKMLKELAFKGCIISVQLDIMIKSTLPLLPKWLKRKALFGNIREDEQMLYSACSFVIGIWEFHLNNMTPELARDMNEYMPYLINDWIKYPQLRTIPIGASLDSSLKVFSYENARELIQKQKHILIAKCVCRVEAEVSGHKCKFPMETCFVFGIAADYYERNKLGRMIDQAEALEILKKVEKAGLVLQPSNSQEVLNICCCCGCCCGVLKNIKKLPAPAQYIPSAFMNTLDSEACNGCGICVKRCQMNALSLVGSKNALSLVGGKNALSQEIKNEEKDSKGKDSKDNKGKDSKKAVLDTSRCIGCGGCVPTCPTKAMQLVRKPETDYLKPSKNTISTTYMQSQTKGKINPINMLKLCLDSWYDRYTAK
ncbi:MAG: 4Fe-4S dicluster domain-containing protein [Desulfamplus sp.]|nr:4Fe-4S dicluster domain-containing protein [Desulfamplus sp.]